jgi:glycosyltransferase involved in cell wall biosynthesis
MDGQVKAEQSAPEPGELLVVIPAYNEEACIGQVLGSVRAHIPQADVLVVDDGSADDTSNRVLVSGAELLRLPYNLGVGAALEVALIHADQVGYPYVLRLDADGQHDPRDGLRLLEAVQRREADVAIGSRFLAAPSNGKYWRNQTTPTRAVGIKVFATLVSLLIGQRISDPTCGLRCFNRAAISFLARYHPQDYPEVESVVVLHRAGFRLKEIPVEIYPRQGGVSSISSGKAIYYVFRVMLAASVAAVRSLPKEVPEGGPYVA